MILSTESTSANFDGLERRDYYQEIDIKTYLTSRWQEAFDYVADAMNEATVVLYQMKPTGYEVIVTNKNRRSPYHSRQFLESSGVDFVDTVRAYGRILLIEDAASDQRLIESKEYEHGYRTMIGIPIRNNNGAIECILSILRSEAISIENSDIKLSSWLASSVEESIKLEFLLQSLRQMSSYDSLTHLITRDKMLLMIQREFDRSQRSEIPFSVLMIDIDDFKSINEKYGVEKGDEVLKEFSEVILSRIRQIDYACRWDGDAFVILCPHTELIGANQLVSDLFVNLTHHNFEPVGRCYFSMGIADFSPKDQSIDEILARLEKALYRVKAFGGNSHMARYHQ
jgi:diguanylate cyclase (GGDEF)-like protein